MRAEHRPHRWWRVRDVIGLAVMVVAIFGLHFVGAWLYYGAKR